MFFINPFSTYINKFCFHKIWNKPLALSITRMCICALLNTYTIFHIKFGYSEYESPFYEILHKQAVSYKFLGWTPIIAKIWKSKHVRHKHTVCFEMSVASWCFCVVLCVSFCTGHFIMVPLIWHIYIVYNILSLNISSIYMYNVENNALSYCI